MELNNGKKYYIIKNRAWADMLRTITRQDYRVYENKFKPEEDVYSFENTEQFAKALRICTDLINENKAIAKEKEIKELKAKINELESK